MYIDQDKMESINKVQLKIFKEFVNVCNELNLEYVVVHGTLLGALIHKGFFPMDDDIDVAMPRKDYNIFLKEGQKYMSQNLFIQSNNSDKEYPLIFAKVRDTTTAFIQPVLDKCSVNKGIYIDVFPIDYYPKSKLEVLKTSILSRILGLRVNVILNIPNTSIKHKVFQSISKIVMPSWNYAIKKLAGIYESYEDEGTLIVYGGKASEKGIPSSWFKRSVNLDFEGMVVKAPAMYDDYMRKIYGDYMNYSPSEKYMNNAGEVEISANIVDVNNSYVYYESRREK